MNEKIDYLIKDYQCAKAIDEFKILTSVPDWLNMYFELYHSVSIKPEGLLSITSSHLDGDWFKNIQRFANLYLTVLALFE
jgi:hypothetical protein